HHAAQLVEGPAVERPVDLGGGQPLALMRLRIERPSPEAARGGAKELEEALARQRARVQKRVHLLNPRPLRRREPPGQEIEEDQRARRAPQLHRQMMSDPRADREGEPDGTRKWPHLSLRSLQRGYAALPSSAIGLRPNFSATRASEGTCTSVSSSC